MVRAFFAKAVLLLVLTLLLAAPIHAAGIPAGSLSADSAVGDILTQVWDFLTGVWARSGCDIDPSGRCVPRSSPTIEIDSTIEPSGRYNR